MILWMTSGYGNARDQFGRGKSLPLSTSYTVRVSYTVRRRNISGSLAKFAAIRRASSRVSRLVAEAPAGAKPTCGAVTA